MSPFIGDKYGIFSKSSAVKTQLKDHSNFLKYLGLHLGRHHSLSVELLLLFFLLIYLWKVLGFFLESLASFFPNCFLAFFTAFFYITFNNFVCLQVLIIYSFCINSLLLRTNLITFFCIHNGLESFFYISKWNIFCNYFI